MDSAARILDLGDDMVTEILLRLPLESIFRFRSVSKQWSTSLTSPEFLSHYSRSFHHRKQRTPSPHNLLGFFELIFRPPRISFLSTQPRIGCEKNFSSDLLGFFITSSNGLVLCGRRHGESLSILNPVTRKHVSLPPPPRKHHSDLPIGLYCDEARDDLTPRYEVVIADVYNPWFTNNKKLRIQQYSSETKEWRASVLVGTSNFIEISPCPPKVVNGVFYWLVERRFLAAYDPRNKDSNHLQLIQLPDTYDDEYYPLDRHVLDQTPGGSLILGQTTSEPRLMQIWELPKRELGFWRETTISKEEWGWIYIDTCEIGLKLVGLMTWNPLTLMVRQGSRVFQYNPKTKRKKHIVSLPGELDQPFFEATSFSSYLLA